MKLLVAILCLLCLGCATTRIQCDDPNAEIIMDGHRLGVGSANVSSIGPPHTARVEAHKHGRKIGSTEMKRSFSFRTILWGMVSYYTGFYWGWYYPDQINVITEKPEPNHYSKDSNVSNPWAHPETSIWMQPL